jgi:hypothetical protein
MYNNEQRGNHGENRKTPTTEKEGDDDNDDNDDNDANDDEDNINDDTKDGNDDDDDDDDDTNNDDDERKIARQGPAIMGMFHGNWEPTLHFVTFRTLDTLAFNQTPY